MRPIVVGLLSFLFALLINSTFASTATSLRAPSDAPAQEEQCRAGGGLEDEVLCEAAKAKRASIQQVVEEDEASREPPETPSADRDVWTAAYEQWIEGKQSAGKPKAVNRALKEAMKRYPDVASPQEKEQQNDFIMPDMDDDELTVITAAVQQISDANVTAERLKLALVTIEELCNSGDNGRQMQAAGGVPHLLRHATSESVELSLLSVRTLATCAQNNPSVFDSAVEEGAVASMLTLADNGNDALRAASLRALVAVADSGKAHEPLQDKKDDVVRIVRESLKKNSGTDGQRCQIRALALVEQCLVRLRDSWKTVFVSGGLIDIAEQALKSDSIDVREGAARVLRMLR
ncbi:hypothetical protein BWQ96_03279 [Gracilariopsis chorda]|uniref:Hsp70 nucleotide exchange factor FES1 n=1 Tax=Gracilariopsis chorda TaxID=448386 RepID=A0A2V3IXU9_9FLOR|nr:hypothetical protein BWQ96_03279 [Gracilariopsis chorda]|eukprot:PXF46941.1 hypothetical protein BWQ96_03279 [Gracilariopsis chorda]